ncbi:MAG: TolC family protein [Pirellulaceae bacterium]
MGMGGIRTAVITIVIGVACAFLSLAQAEHPFQLILPEQRAIRVRDPSELVHVEIPHTPRPPTVSALHEDLSPRYLSLDETIRTALANAEIIRVLAGVIAVSSGRTIYDTAIVNNGVDEQNAVFDPRVSVQNGFNRLETPGIIFDPSRISPLPPVIEGLRRDDYRMDFDLSKPTITGGTFRFGVTANPAQSRPTVSILDPQSRSNAELSYTQPLLQGSGVRANLARIVLARIDTERSFFQFKDSVQELVRGVIQAYWDSVFARTDVWARQQQLDQLQEAFDRAEALYRVDIQEGALVDQARVALLNARATVLQSRSNVLDREAALRSILGFPPYDTEELIPTTPPTKDRIAFDWHSLLDLAAQQRPDIIELKLVLEADEQQLLLANNQALPRVDAIALYRWNGLEGEMPAGTTIASRPGQFTDWTMGINFSVPLGLRRERAALRRRELILARDRANLQQGLLEVSHELAADLRNLDLAYDQYVTFRDTRIAAKTNLEAQSAEFNKGRTIFLNVLLAISDWGNAVSNEARTLLQYNTLLANMELRTGTILDSHGIRFYEERYGTISPLGRFHMPQSYPAAQRPTRNQDRYPQGDSPAEDLFDLQNPLERLPE